MKIDDFEIKSYGEVKFSEWKHGRKVEYTFNCVPRDIIRWLVNCSSAPELSDFEAKIKDHEGKKKKGDAVIGCSGFWAKD